MNLLSILLFEMINCKKCGLKKPLVPGGDCEECAGRFRARMESMSHVMDTKSFMLPARRNIVWVWAAVTLGILLLVETVYMLWPGP
jgi:hypothetical protein